MSTKIMKINHPDGHLTIRTNHHGYPLWSYPEALQEVGGKERTELMRDFDYIDTNDWSPRLFRYKGDWYDIQEFESLHPRPNDMTEGLRVEMYRQGWHGIQTSSVWTAILVAYMYDDGTLDAERVKVAYAYWG